MLKVIKWTAFAGLVVTILPYSVEKPWGFRLAVLFSIFQLVFSYLDGFHTATDILVKELKKELNK